jgi:fumarate reductase flavoprotein subunit
VSSVVNKKIEKTVVAPGFRGDVCVTVAVEDGKIISCKAIGEKEDPEYGYRALQEIPERILSAGTPEVDAVAGATVTSQAIIAAAQAAFDEANGTVTAPLRMKPGKYTASTLGYQRTQQLPVTVTVNETAFLKIETPADRFSHAETEVILECVKEKLFPRMIESQSLAIDAIAGATVTSNSIKASVAKALKQALQAGGSDERAMSRFYNKPAQVDAGNTEEKETDILVVGLGNGGIFSMVSAMEQMQKHNGLKSFLTRGWIYVGCTVPG